MKTHRFVLDTSFVLALLNPSDILHNQAKERLFLIEADTISFEIPLICVIETLIKNPYPNEFISLLTELIDYRDFELTTTADLEYIAKLPLKIRTSLKANDCSVIAITKRLKAQLLTLDKKLLKVNAVI